MAQDLFKNFPGFYKSFKGSNKLGLLGAAEMFQFICQKMTDDYQLDEDGANDVLLWAQARVPEIKAHNVRDYIKIIHLAYAYLVADIHRPMYGDYWRPNGYRFNDFVGKGIRYFHKKGITSLEKAGLQSKAEELETPKPSQVPTAPSALPENFQMFLQTMENICIELEETKAHSESMKVQKEEAEYRILELEEELEQIKMLNVEAKKLIAQRDAALAEAESKSVTSLEKKILSEGMSYPHVRRHFQSVSVRTG